MVSWRLSAPPTIAKSTMIITCQHEWVEQCQQRYRVEPSLGYHFEDAHYPEPECRNGLETVKLWYPDHIVHGALQTLNLQHPCMHGYRVHREREIVQQIYPEYQGIYEEAYLFHQSYAGKRGAHSLHQDKTNEGKSIQGIKNADRMNKTLHREKDDFGRSLSGVRSAKRLHSVKNELGKSITGLEAAKRNNSQIWESVVDGFRSNLGNVAKHNKKHGWDPTARFRVS